MKSLLPLLLLAAATLPAAEPIELKLWPEGAPGKMAPHSQATADFIRTKAGKSTITDIHDPTITVYRPEKPNGTSVIVAPGGGYVFLSAVHEGTQVCEWLNSIGVTGILLKYRTPTRDEAAPHEKPVQDAVKAISLVRTNAKEWQLDPRRVGLLGFSAGGNLLAYVACAQDLNVPSETKGPFGEPVRPDFGIMIYGGGWLDPKDPTKLKEGFTVSFNSTPLFIACAHDDGQNPVAATALYLEYKKQNLPAELHLFTKGGHGFGMRDNKQPINAWPQRCAEWMESSRHMWTAKVYDQAIDEMAHAREELEKRSLGFKELFKKVAAQINEARENGQTAQEATLREEYARLKKLHSLACGPVSVTTNQEDVMESDRLMNEILKLTEERAKYFESKAAPKSP